MTEKNSTLIDIVVPDLGSDAGAEVIEILHAIGDSLNKDDIIVVLESDKATMEIPTDSGGVLSELLVKIGDQVNSGDLLARLASEVTSETKSQGKQDTQEKQEKVSVVDEGVAEKKADAVSNVSAAVSQYTFVEKVPDTGSDEAAELIELNVKVGDLVKQDDILLVLESDKATMEIPASHGGKITQLFVKIGDALKNGDAIVEMRVDGEDASRNKQTKLDVKADSGSRQVEKQASPKTQKTSEVSTQAISSPQPVVSNHKVHAGPAARRLARELGVDLTQVKASGPKERILKDDIKSFVKATLARGGATGTSVQLPPVFDLPEIDFAKFGEVESKKLSRIKKVSARNLSRSWVNIPHVTQFDEADITELEVFRKEQSETLKAEGIKLTVLAFLVKASAHALKEFPDFNASLDKNAETLILKKYFHIGVAVDTADGLVVPVLRNVNCKTISEIAQELTTLSQKARDKKLLPQEMQGACFSISSLGGIGGTAFTPIVNWPEVAILGVSRSMTKPVYIDGNFEPRLMLPLSLSYDHRVIDGAAGARFIRYFADLLADIRKLTL